MDTSSLLQIVYVVIILALVWLALRFVFKLAAKVFTCGCSIILALGALLVLWQWLGSA